MKGNEELDVAAIIVAHNASHQLRDCIASLQEHTEDCRVGLVVVDSGSTDATVAVASETGTPVVRCSNIGYGAGNNLGWQIAPPARYLLLLNPDAVILAGSIRELVAHADGCPHIAAFAPRIVDVRGNVVASIGVFESPMRVLLDRLRGRSIGHRYVGVTDVRAFDWAMGCALFLRAECFERVNGFDERFFLYSEERDLLRTFNTMGWRHETYPRLTVRHDSEDRVPDSRLFAQRFRADLYYARKWHGAAGVLAVRAGLALDIVRRLTLGEPDDWRDPYRGALRMLLTERVHHDPVKGRLTQLQRTLR